MVKLINLYNSFNIKARHKGSIILIGNFDGLHLGHQKLFTLAKKYKKKYSLRVGVLTFEPMPKMYFNKDINNFRISNQKQKISLLNKFSVDFVIVKNIEQIKFTGKKFQNKKYFRHTGHPGGIKVSTPEKLHEKKPEEALKLAVKRMLPGGVLGRKQLLKLKIYSGTDHPHTAQNPKIIDLEKLNTKNLIRN